MFKKLSHMSTPLLKTHQAGLSIDGAVLLENVSTAFYPGEVVGLIGPNGAGKSTLLRLLGGLWRASSGSVEMNGRPLGSYSARDLARLIAHVPQSTALDFAFTVREVVLMGRTPHLGRFQLEGIEDRLVAEEAMRAMVVQALADRFINTLSGGERQRVFVARALAQQPHVLLLDEPTANLDVRFQLDLLEKVSDLAHEKSLTVLAAIHDLDLAAHFCDRLVLLHQGRVLADGQPDMVLTADYLAEAFGVAARPFRDPFTDTLRLSLTRKQHPLFVPG
jgi:iron complex transport system ATP-binding protein